MLFIKKLDKHEKCSITLHALSRIVKGSTADSDSVCEDSNLSPASPIFLHPLFQQEFLPFWV